MRTYTGLNNQIPEFTTILGIWGNFGGVLVEFKCDTPEIAEFKLCADSVEFNTVSDLTAFVEVGKVHEQIKPAHAAAAGTLVGAVQDHLII